MPAVGRRSERRIVIGVLLAAICSVAAAAPARREDDAFQMLREEKLISSASKRLQPMSETPSIVTVIPAQEIEAQGYRTLGEALQWVRGLYTRYDRNYTYLGVRGLQRPGDYNNKVLLTIDGHRMNSPIYGDAAFGRELGLDMEQVERIEVIRGPGSALYGSNAFLAVVNVVTREGRSAPAVRSSASVGSFGERRALVGLAGSHPGLPEYTVTGSLENLAGAAFDPSSGAPGLGGAAAIGGLDRNRSWNLLGNARWGETRLEAHFNDRLKHVPTGAYGTRLGDPGTYTRDAHDFVELSTIALPLASVEMNGRAYWDGARYSGEYAYGPDSARYLNEDLGLSDVLGAEMRLNLSPARGHATTIGVEGRWILRAFQSNADLDPYYLYTRSNRRRSVASLYLQDEMRLPGQFRITAGARLDGEAGDEPVWSPRVDLLLPMGSDTQWKLMAGSAFRAPVPYETDYTFETQIPNPNLLPERVTTLESSVEHRIGATRYGLSVYRSWIRDLIDVTPVDSLGRWGYFNRGRVASTGVEGEVNWSALPGLAIRADLAWQRSRDASAPVDLSNSPHWDGHFVMTQFMPDLPLNLGLGMRWLGARTTLAAARLPSCSVLDARLGWKPRSPVELGLECRNLLDVAYADPGGTEHFQDAIAQDGRTVYVTLSLSRAVTP